MTHRRGEGSTLTFASQWILSREDVPSQSSVPSTDLAADDLPHTEAKSQVMKQFNGCAAEAWKTQIPCTSSRQFCRHLSNELLDANFCTEVLTIPSLSLPLESKEASQCDISPWVSVPGAACSCCCTDTVHKTPSTL